MSQLVAHTDSECDDPRCPLHNKHGFEPAHANGVGAEACAECGFKPIKLIEAWCEGCYHRVVLGPVVKRWNELVALMDQAHTELSLKLSKVTQSPASENFNLHITCVCGKVYNSGIAMYKHLPDCEGPKPKQVHRRVYERAAKIDLKNFKIG